MTYADDCALGRLTSGQKGAFVKSALRVCVCVYRNFNTSCHVDGLMCTDTRELCWAALNHYGRIRRPGTLAI